jgi:tRNA modification GTPase
MGVRTVLCRGSELLDADRGSTGSNRESCSPTRGSDTGSGLPDPYDTIVALSTPPGEGAIALVRLSGPRCLEVAERIFRGSGSPRELEPRKLCLGQIRHPGRRVVVDEVVAAVFRAPRSYTTQDMFEISCHGGRASVRAVLEAALAAGARLAEPGEFTLRAFLGGRLDLAQAEAVAMLVSARSEAQRRTALRQLRGSLSRSVHEAASSLTHALAELEASIDFPEDDPDAQRCPETVLAEIGAAAARLKELLRNASSVHLLSEGARVAVVGKPNVGKSSLLNALCGHQRAIVTEESGTTRDTIEVALELGELPVTLIDTAGLGPPADGIDRESQQRASKEIDDADLCLVVLDSSAPLDGRDRAVLAAIPAAASIVVRNKCDLVTTWPVSRLGPLDAPVVTTSCLTGSGMKRLKERVAEMLKALLGNGGGPTVASARHQEALRYAARHLEEAHVHATDGSWPEVVAEDLRQALAWLRRITGEQVGDDLLREIFSRFCVGK